jgi:hypothetical protein
MPTDTLLRPVDTAPATGASRMRLVAAVSAAAMSLLYLAIYAGLLSVGRADTGEIGILGIAGGVFAVLAVLLWRVRSRALWLGAAALQVVLAAMYVAIAPERDPSYELWGLTIRGLSLVLLVAVVSLLLGSRRH